MKDVEPGFKAGPKGLIQIQSAIQRIIFRSCADCMLPRLEVFARTILSDFLLELYGIQLTCHLLPGAASQGMGEWDDYSY